MNKYQAYLTLLGFITEKCNDNVDKEWMLTEALETLYNQDEPEVKEDREPLITNKILNSFK